jgi:hypothetical protein
VIPTRITVLFLKIVARQVRRYAYSVALLCALVLVLLALFSLRVVEKTFACSDGRAI